MAYVYVHIVKATGQMYFGQTDQKPEKRWGYKGNKYKGQAFYRIIKEFGWDNMLHQVIHKDITQDKADELEAKYIARYHTFSDDEDHGFNKTIGGKDGAGSPGGFNPNARGVECIETGEVWECANYCAKDIDVNPASLQESLYHGYKCKGKHYKYIDDENYKTNKGPNGVRRVNTDLIWPNIKAFAEYMNVTTRSAARYCRGDRKAPDGFEYEYCVI